MLRSESTMYTSRTRKNIYKNKNVTNSDKAMVKSYISDTISTNITEKMLQSAMSLMVSILKNLGQD